MAGKFPWRQAATLILARDGEVSRKIKNRIEKQTEIIYIKRSTKSTDVFSSQHTFPGGKIDAADFSGKWWSLYERLSAKVGSDSVRQFLHSTVGCDNGLQLYKESEQTGIGIPAHVAFRICAIREMFEETGLLLCLGLDGLSEREFWDLPQRGTTHFNKISNLSEWREFVHSDANKFIDLCFQYNCVPNVWSLVEWSNWLTPPHLAKRWDTIFYVSTMDEGIIPSADRVETSSVNWFKPMEILKLALKGEVSMPVPTTYESNRLNRFYNAGMLMRFARWRAHNYPCMRVSPDVRRSEKYIFIGLLPSDESYGKNRDSKERGEFALLDTGGRGLVNRYVRSSSGEESVVCNAVPIDGHLIPSLFTQHTIKSKL